MRTNLAVLTLVTAFGCASLAQADPITVNGGLNGSFVGAQFIEEIDLTFPAFNLQIVNLTHLQPGIPEGSGLRSFTQTTGDFQGQAFVSPLIGGGGGSPAHVEGRFDFFGPTVTVPPVNGPFDNVNVNADITWSGMLNIAQGPQTLFNGALAGSGLGTIGAGFREVDFFYNFSMQGVSATPEPASIVLLGTGLAWMIRRRRDRTMP
jgi:hypothetical protein